MENPALADLFDEMADLLELDGAIVFRVRAYRNAAREIRDLSTPVRELVDANPAAITEIPGIGADLAGKITHAVRSGDFEDHRTLRAKFPPGLLELLRIPQLGPKRVKLLYDKLQIHSPDDLRAAIAEGRLAEVRGFGLKSVEKLREELGKLVKGERRLLLAEADRWAQNLLEYLRSGATFQAADVAGSLRRRRDTIGDLDIILGTSDPAPVVERFVTYPEVQAVLAQGDTKASVRLRGGPQVDLRIVTPAEYGAALLYFTGSKAHNIELRKIAQGKHLKLNEYGLFRGNRRLAGKTEPEVYGKLGLAWIPPELREARGEIERAKQGEIPPLVTLEDIRGELHAHTTATDGKASLEDMVEGARRLGYRYLAITDHSKRVTMARGLDPKRLRQQWKAIDALNESMRGFTVLKSVELDILDDATLDLPDDVLAEADYVVACIHYGAGKRAADNTTRLVAAAVHPSVDAIGHPTGRLLNRREAYPIDLDALIAACVETGCLLELNGHPDRMDLPDHLAIAAADKGVRFVCGTDAHAVGHMEYMRYAVSIARRAGLTKEQVINTRPLKEFRHLLKRHRRTR